VARIGEGIGLGEECVAVRRSARFIGAAFGVDGLRLRRCDACLKGGGAGRKSYLGVEKRGSVFDKRLVGHASARSLRLMPSAARPQAKEAEE
jgi:hypothetical protein